MRDRIRTELASLRSRVIIMLSLTLIPIGAIAIANAYYGYEHYRGLVSNQALAAGEDAARRGEALIERSQNLLLAFAAIPSTVLSERCHTLVSRLLLQYSEYGNMAAFNSDGSLICSGMQEKPPVSSGWFDEAIKGRPFTLAKQTDQATDQEPMIVAVAPLPNEQSSAGGALAIYIRAAALEQTLDDAVLPEGAAIVILSRDNTILAQRSNQTAAKTWLPPEQQLIQHREGSAGVFDTKGRDGISRRYLITSLTGDLFAIYGIPVSSISASANFLLYSNAASAALMWIAALITAGIAISHLVTRPLRHIRRSINSYSTEGNTYLTDIDDLPDEIRSLAETLNGMAETITKRDAALQDAVASQKALTREVHHRVRNNLQIINSLMSLQSRRASQPSEVAIFAEVQRRVTALGLVHGAIYQGDDMRSVKLGTLLTDLCAATELALSDEKPALFVHADEMSASADIAVPLAFLITEVLGETTLHRTTNLPAEIHISLTRLNDGGILKIEADAPLFDSEAEVSAVNRNAISLLAGLTRQLGGTQELSPDRKILTIHIPVMAPRN